MRVLFADDHVMMREALRPHIERIADDVELVEAGSGPEVRALLADGRFDLVVVDLKMPGMQGVESLKQMIGEHPDTRFVVLSSTTDPDCIDELLRGGAAGFVPKNLSTAQMRVALQLVLAGERYVPSLMLDRERHPAGRSPAQGPEAKGLTRREQEALDLVCEGLPNKLIAERLGVGEVTVKTHLKNLFRKLNVKSRQEAVALYGRRTRGR